MTLANVKCDYKSNQPTSVAQLFADTGEVIELSSTVTQFQIDRSKKQTFKVDAGEGYKCIELKFQSKSIRGSDRYLTLEVDGMDFSILSRTLTATIEVDLPKVMRDFFFGNKFRDPTGGVLFEPPKLFTANIVVNLIGGGQQTHSNLEAGTIHSFDVLNWDTCNIKFYPISGKILEAYRNLPSRPLDIARDGSYAEFDMYNAQIIDDNNDPELMERSFVIECETPKPTTQINKYKVGNSRTGSNVLSQNGEQTYKAKIVVTNPDKATDYVLAGGVTNPIEIILSVSEVSLVCEANEGYQFTEASFRNSNYIPTEPNGFTYKFSRSQIDRNNTFYQEILLRMKKVDSFNIFFGNSLDNDEIKFLPPESYSGKVEVTGEYDQVNGEYRIETYNIFSGDNIPIGVDSHTRGVKITLNVANGYEFIGVKFPTEATFTNNLIEYWLPSEYYDPDNQLNDIKVCGVTKATGGVDPEPSDKPDTILNNYLLTKDEFNKFRDDVYFAQAMEGSGGTQIENKLTSYVSKTLLYPFKIPNTNIYERSHIVVRDRTFNIATLLNKDNIIVNMGTLSVPRIYNNAMDFVEVECNLFMPYFDSNISINPILVIGKNLQIEIVVNITDGSTTVNILDVDSNEYIYVGSERLGTVMPFFNFTQINETQYTPSEKINNIVSPTMQVLRPDYGDVIPKVVVRESILDRKGFFKLDDVNLVGNLNYEENSLIQTMLNSGVLVK